MTDLWPDDLMPPEVETPGAILREQAALLEEKTGGLLHAEVQARTDDTIVWFYLRFTNVVDPLGPRDVFFIACPPRLYPAQIIMERRRLCVARTPAQLREGVAKALASPKVRALVGTMVAVARDRGGPYHSWEWKKRKAADDADPKRTTVCEDAKKSAG